MRTSSFKLFTMFFCSLLMSAIPGFSQFFGGQFSSTFDSNPPGSQLVGNAYIDGGVLHLTDAANSQAGFFHVLDPLKGTPISEFNAKFNVRLGGGTARPADGMSFSFGNDIPSTFTAEDGGGTGLKVTMDHWDNNNDDTAPAIEVVVGGLVVASQSLDGQREGGRAPAGPLLTDGGGNPVALATGDEFVPMEINLDSDGTVDVWFKGVAVFTDLPTGLTLPISGASVAFGARTGGANDNHWVDDLNIHMGPDGSLSFVEEPAGGTYEEFEVVTLSTTVLGTAPYEYQWLFDGSPIAGANASTYSFVARPNVAGDYAVAVNNPEGPLISAAATVEVLPGLRYDGQFSSGFSSAPLGAQASGNAYVADGVLHVTDAANGQAGFYRVVDPYAGAPITQINIQYNVRIGGGTARPADGMSVSFGNDIPATFTAEEGGGTGLRVSFDHWDNNNEDTAPAIEVYYNNALLGFQSLAGQREGGRDPAGPLLMDGGGNPVAMATGDEFVPVEINLDPDGTLDVSFKGFTIFENLATGYSPISGADVVFAARTGGANDNHWVDDLDIKIGPDGPLAFLAEPSSAAVNEFETVTLAATVTGTGPYQYQWYKDGVAIETIEGLAPILRLVATEETAGDYYVQVVNATETITSATATIDVTLGVRFDGQFSANFTDGTTPPGSQLIQGNVAPSPYIADGVLHLTDAANDQAGRFIIEDPFGGMPVTEMKVSFDLRIGGGTARPADGFSYNFNNDTPLGAGFTAEDGVGNGLRVTFDHWDSGNGDPAPAIEVFYGGVVIGVQSTDPAGGLRPTGGAPVTPLLTDPATGGPLAMSTGDSFQPVMIKLDPDGTLDLTYKNVTIFDNLATGYTPISGGNHFFAARTGGANDNHWLDNVAIQVGGDGPLNIAQQPSSAELLEGESFTTKVIVTGTPPYSYQWYKDGAAIPDAVQPSLSFVGNVSESGTYTVEIGSPSGTLVSDPAVINVQTDLQAPTILSALSPDFAKVVVQFSEAVDPTTATDPILYSLTGPGGGVAINQAVMVSPSTVELILGGALDVATDYSLVVNGISDISANMNVIDLNTTVNFQSWDVGCGGLYFESFLDIGGVAVVNLTDNAKYPNSPDETALIERFDTRLIYSDDTHENYGARLRGVFIPPSSGNWVFYLTSDDASQLFLNPDGLDPAGAQIIVQQPGCCNAIASLFSAPIALEGGKGYFIEGLLKEGGGGDYMQVAVTREGDPAPTDASAQSIPGSMLGAPAAPRGVGGALDITSQPASISAVENTIATFSVGIEKEYDIFPVCYQWLRNGIEIPGANGPSYSTGFLTLAENGDIYSVQVQIPGTTLVSDQAVLSVGTDMDAPVLVSAEPFSSFDRVRIRYNESMMIDSATDFFGYFIVDPNNPDPGAPLLAVTSVEKDFSDPLDQTFILYTSIQDPDTDYLVMAIGKSDLAGNTGFDFTTAAFTSYSLSCGFSLREYWTSIPGVLVSDLTMLPTYPNSPNMQDYGSAVEGPLNVLDNYGIKVSGFLQPKVSGSFDFFMSSDDAGELWLSTDMNPANKRLIASEPVWNGSRDWTGTTRRDPANPENRSTTLFPDGIPLVAGELYYYEAIAKEGGGGDNVGATAILHGSDLPANGSPAIMSGALFQLIVGAPSDGAGVTITQQPQDFVFAVGCDIEGGAFADVDFASGNGSFSVVNGTEGGGTPAGPWTYRPATGTWGANGGEGVVNSKLQSPEFTVAQSGAVTLNVLHRYFIEDDGTTRWDAGQIRVSRNGGPYVAVEADAFSANGYPTDRTIGGNSPPLNGQFAFNGKSAGYDAGEFITSVATLGAFTAGDTISIEFLGAWDEGYVEPSVNWEIAGMQLVQGGASGGGFTATFEDDFEAGLPADTAVYGNATVTGGHLSLTDAANGQNGSFVINDFTGGAPVEAFVARFGVRIADGTARPADGFSFNFANDLPDGPFVPPAPFFGAEDGGGTGLSISFDTWDNGAPDTAPAIEVIYGGESKGVVSMAGERPTGPPVTTIPTDPATGQPMSLQSLSGEFVDVEIKLDPDGTVDVSFKGVLVLENIETGFVPTVGRFGLGGRTGNANESHWIDNLFIGIGEEGTGGGNAASFAVVANGFTQDDPDAPLFYQWQQSTDGGATYNDIAGANRDTLALKDVDPESAAGTLYRSVIYTPGAVVTSDAAAIATSQAPQVAITSPADGSVAPAGSTAVIVADATDADGTVVRVEFFAVGIESALGADTDGTDGWSLTIPDVQPGTYILTAVATDDQGVSCSSAPITVTVTDNTPPVANDDSAVTDEDLAVVIDVLANDTDADGDALSVALVSGPANGTATLNPDGTVAYTPAPNFNGSDTFTYTVNDGSEESNVATVTITVNPVNDAPTCSDTSGSGDEDSAITITLGGADIDGDALTFTASNGANGSVSVSGNVATYTGVANFCGTDTFSFTVSDGVATATCEATVTVNAVNDAPTAVIQVSPQADLGDTVSGIVVISADGETACITLDASETFDIDEVNGCGEIGAAEGYTWLDAAGNVLGTGVTIEACLPVGPQTITLLLDDGDAVGETTVVVEVLTPCEAVEELVMQVEESVIERDNKRPFLATLKTACAAFDRGSYGSALNRLSNAFQNKVRAQVGKANPDVAEEWIRIAQVIIDAIGDYRP